jgi:hypothetical protein
MATTSPPQDPHLYATCSFNPTRQTHELTMHTSPTTCPPRTPELDVDDNIVDDPFYADGCIDLHEHVVSIDTDGTTHTMRVDNGVSYHFHTPDTADQETIQTKLAHAEAAYRASTDAAIQLAIPYDTYYNMSTSSKTQFKNAMKNDIATSLGVNQNLIKIIRVIPTSAPAPSQRSDSSTTTTAEIRVDDASSITSDMFKSLNVNNEVNVPATVTRFAQVVTEGHSGTQNGEGDDHEDDKEEEEGNDHEDDKEEEEGNDHEDDKEEEEEGNDHEDDKEEEEGNDHEDDKEDERVAEEERVAAEAQAEEDRLAAEAAAAEAAAAEVARVQAEKEEAERVAEAAAAEVARVQAEKEEEDRLAAEAAAAEAAAAEAAAAEVARVQAEKEDAERVAAEAAQAEKERIAAEAQAKEERLAAAAEVARVQAEKEEAERVAAEAAQAEEEEDDADIATDGTDEADGKAEGGDHDAMAKLQQRVIVGGCVAILLIGGFMWRKRVLSFNL